MNDNRIDEVFDSPWSFGPTKEMQGVELRYLDLMELFQGGPLTGRLFINGNQISPKDKFGGPALIDRETVTVPIYCKT